jgi:hypothetical protein
MSCIDVSLYRYFLWDNQTPEVSPFRVREAKGK